MQAATESAQPVVSFGNDDDRPLCREAFVVFVGAICFILIQLMPLRSLSMLARPLWLDECITDIIVSEPSTQKAYSGLLAGGVDANPPAYYALMRAVALTGLHSPTVYRTTSMILIAAALAGVYALLRLSFDRYSSLIGALGVWTIPLVVEHAFEARFYALLLAATVWFAYLSSRAERSRFHQVVAAFCAVVACATHWFGIIGITLVLIGEVMLRLRDGWPMKALLAAGAGPIALLACVPLLIAQRNAIGGETFVGGNPVRAAYAYYILLLPGGAAAILLLAAVERLVAPHRYEFFRPPNLKPLLGMMLLGLMPICLVAVSIILQPVMQLRYTIVATAAMAIPVAFGATLIRRHVWRTAGAALMVLVSFNSLFRVWLEKKEFVDELTVINEHVQLSAARNEQVLFALRHDQYPVIWNRPPTAAHCFFVSDELVDESPLRGFERTMALRTEKLAGAPRTIDLETANARFLFIAETDDAAAVMKVFPLAAVEPLGERVFRITR